MAAESRAAMLRKLLKGRTIVDLDAKAVNVLSLTLDNGAIVDLEVVSMGNQIYGIVPCLCRDKRDHKPVRKRRAFQG